MIREASEGDIPKIVELGRRFLLEGPYRDHLKDDPEALRNAALSFLQNPQAKILLFREGTQTVGMLIFLLFPHYFTGEATAGEIVWYVIPEARGGMAGLRLLNAAERLASSLGAKRMQMVAPTDRIAELYKRRGYGFIESTYQRELT